MEIRRDQTFEVAPDVLFQEVDGEMVLLDLAGENYFGLDEIGTRIWNMLRTGASVGAVVDSLEADYEVDAATLEADVGDLLAQLVDAGLINA